MHCGLSQRQKEILIPIGGTERAASDVERDPKVTSGGSWALLAAMSATTFPGTSACS